MGPLELEMELNVFGTVLSVLLCLRGVKLNCGFRVVAWGIISWLAFLMCHKLVIIMVGTTKLYAKQH